MHAVYHRIEGSPLGARLARGAFWSVSGSLVSRGLGFLAAVLVGRLLGKEDFGALGIVQNTIAMFGTVAGFSMGLTANKHVAEFKRADPARAGRIIGAATTLAWLTSGVMSVVLLVAAEWLAATTLAAPHLAGLLRLGALLLLLSGINGAQMGALSGFESFKPIARINLVAGLVSFPLMLLGAGRWGLTGVVWALIVTQSINNFLCWRALRAEALRFGVPIRRHTTPEDRRLFWSFSLPAVLTGVLNSLVGWGAGALVVNQAGGYGDMGLYNAALRVKLLPELSLGMLIAPMLPILSEAFGKNDQHTFQRALQFNFTLAALIIIPVSLVQTAAPSLTMLIFGAGYRGGFDTVQWLMLHAVSYALLFPMGSILISMGQMWFSWLVGLCYGVLFAAGAWWLVPRYGSAGYAAAMVLAYLISNIPCVVFLYYRLPRVMSFLHWGLVASVLFALYALCLAASHQLTLAWATTVGSLAGAAFLGLHYWLHGAGAGRQPQ
jgi:O-antigen/teichoic acid export membrane protein